MYSLKMIGEFLTYLLASLIAKNNPQKLLENSNYYYDEWDSDSVQNIANDAPKSAIMKHKGLLRITWNYDIKYNKKIDLIFFPLESLLINYAYLFAKDLVKLPDKKGFPNDNSYPFVDTLNAPYDINYDFVKEILGEDNAEVFFKYRFGGIFMPIEVEFEWYITDEPFMKGDRLSIPSPFEWEDLPPVYNLVGIIKNYKTLPLELMHSFFEDIKQNYRKELSYQHSGEEEQLRLALVDIDFSPIPVTAFLRTKTKFNDFYVNLREEPNKDSKILATLFSQEFYGDYPDDLRTWGPAGDANMGQYNNFQEELAIKLYEEQKDNLSKALLSDKYNIILKEILPNNWVYVYVIRSMVIDNITNFNERKYDAGIYYELNPDLVKDYIESPSFFIIKKGYIHASGLEYLTRDELTPRYMKIDLNKIKH